MVIDRRRVPSGNQKDVRVIVLYLKKAKVDSIEALAARLATQATPDLIFAYAGHRGGQLASLAKKDWINTRLRLTLTNGVFFV